MLQVTLMRIRSHESTLNMFACGTWRWRLLLHLLIQTLVLGMWPWRCKDYVYLWNGCNNDLCTCVLHLKLWMLALIQGLALQSQGSFSFIKEGSYTFYSSKLMDESNEFDIKAFHSFLISLLGYTHYYTIEKLQSNK